MFIFTTKLNRRKIILIVLAIAVIISAMILASPTRLLYARGRSDEAMAEQAVSKKAGSDKERLTFIKSFGWEVQEEPLEMSEVVIPEEFDEVYTAYNEIQKEQGFDLKRFRGKKCMMYTYKVTNHPSGEKEARANILVYKDKVIGGDVCSLNLDGFMHGFKMPGKEDKDTSAAQETQNKDAEKASAGQDEQKADGIYIEE
ncbi:MAG: DUF4830 domain-containing protein [Bacillota bacterium]|nr:DUF4830 domain-containing protein [Bacillota bacterium]